MHVRLHKLWGAERLIELEFLVLVVPCVVIINFTNYLRVLTLSYYNEKVYLEVYFVHFNVDVAIS